MHSRIVVSLFFIIIISGCGASGKKERVVTPTTATVSPETPALFKSVCASCHGEDGKKRMLEAADLSLSSLNVNEIISIIRNGKGVMPAYGQSLTEKEISDLAAYAVTLQK